MEQEIICPASESRKTLENFLKKRFPIGYVRKVLRKNGVRVNGRRAKPEDFIGPNDRLRLYIPFEKKPAQRTSHRPFRPDLETLFEDQDLVVINKPAGLVVHEAKGILKRDTLIAILENRYRNQGMTPRLVHRLDKDTSGIIVIAKNPKAAEALELCFQEAKTRKEYLCLVAGRLQEKSGTIDMPLPGREGKPVSALTRFRIIRSFSETTLLRVSIATGRMHQVRLHLASMGYPIVMDDQHGDFRFNRQFRQSYGLKRQFLHAHRLGLEYRGTKHLWRAPLSEDLRRTLNALEAVNHNLAAQRTQ